MDSNLPDMQELTNDLLVLRAGISLVAAEKSKCDMVTEKYANLEKTVCQKYFGQNTIPPAIKPKNNRAHTVIGFASAGCCILYIAFTILLFYLEIFGLAWICGLVALALAVVAVTKLSTIKSNKLRYKVAFDLYENIVKNTPIAEEETSELRVQCINECKIHREQAKSLYSVFAEKYSEILDERDWVNLDLIIFYLQTGRAENLKEALQQVDRQRQTDAIVGAINNAAKEICNTFRQESERTRQVIVACTSLIEQKLNTLIAYEGVQAAILVGSSMDRIMQDVHTVIA